MKLSLSRILLKLLKITGITIGSLLALLFIAPYVFPNTISEKIKQWANSSIKGELNFSKARLSFFNHFPSLTLTLHDFSLKGSAPYASDTLIAAEKLSLGINLKSLFFDKEVNVNKIFLTHAFLNVQIDEKGQANYNVYVSETKQQKAPRNNSEASMKIEKIEIDDSHLVYYDRSIPMAIDAKDFYYTGKGDLSKAVFDLQSHIQSDSLNFNFDNQFYLEHKQIDASLVTKINTDALAFSFEKNDLTINRLPLQFTGRLDFLKNGYDMDFSFKSLQSDFHDLITALPPEYLSWLQKAEVKGVVDLSSTLKGQYIASTNTMPEFALDLKLRNGYVAYEKAPFPANNLLINCNVKLPSLSTDSLKVNLDSLFFTVDKDYFRASFRSTGLAQPYIQAKAESQMDLDKLDKALGLSGFHMKGKFNLQLNAEGKYATGPDPKSLRKKDTVILSIPKFNIQSSLQNGYLKYSSLPEALTNIHLIMHASCPDNDYKKAGFRIDTINAVALNNFIKGSASVNSMKDFPLEASLQSSIDLADIKKIYPLDSMTLGGLLKLAINTRGKYAPDKKLFPHTTADIQLHNGSIQTKYYPHPIEQIEVSAKASDPSGTLRDLQVFIEPASFRFEGKPFAVKASLKNFDDIGYDIQAKGEIDIGKVYQVFSQKGMGVNGYAKANVSLKGRQSDATNGRYADLRNSGTIALKDIEVSHEYFPKPFFIKQGLFSFRQDKMWFDKFLAGYGKSQLSMDGYLSNVINYFLSTKEKLSGNFNLQSDFISVDEFTAFASAADSNKGSDGRKEIKVIQTSESNTGTGVVMVPANLDLIIKANVNTVSYNGLDIKDFTGGLTISNSQLRLNETDFNLIGCQVNMDGLYGNTSPTKAFFEYHLLAKDFDVKRAYNEVKLFHDLFTSAGKAEGIISIDYNLKGRLNADMYPVYPSLAGGGVVSVKKVKVKGLKLFNVVSSKTDKQDLKDPDLSKIDFKSTIKNNIITLERTKFKTAGLRIRIEGQTSFDNKIKFKMRIGLPPLGIIGIPMNITGTSDNPVVKLGRGDKEDLKETEDTEDDSAPATTQTQ